VLTKRVDWRWDAFRVECQHHMGRLGSTTAGDRDLERHAHALCLDLVKGDLPNGQNHYLRGQADFTFTTSALNSAHTAGMAAAGRYLFIDKTPVS
jgi:hypothetical protein